MVEWKLLLDSEYEIRMNIPDSMTKEDEQYKAVMRARLNLRIDISIWSFFSGLAALLSLYLKENYQLPTFVAAGIIFIPLLMIILKCRQLNRLIHIIAVSRI